MAMRSLRGSCVDPVRDGNHNTKHTYWRMCPWNLSFHLIFSKPHCPTHGIYMDISRTCGTLAPPGILDFTLSHWPSWTSHFTPVCLKVLIWEWVHSTGSYSMCTHHMPDPIFCHLLFPASISVSECIRYCINICWMNEWMSAWSHSPFYQEVSLLVYHYWFFFSHMYLIILFSKDWCPSGQVSCKKPLRGRQSSHISGWPLQPAGMPH